MASVRIRRAGINTAAIVHTLAEPGGPFERQMLRRGQRVQAVAKVLAPKDKGALADSINIEIFRYNGLPAVRIFSRLRYARWQHDGTGIYGSRGAPIRPVRAKLLRFTPKGSTTVVYARQVRGAPPTKFLTRALPAARL